MAPAPFPARVATQQSTGFLSLFRCQSRRPKAGSILGMIAVFLVFVITAGGIFVSPAGVSSWLNVAAEIGIVALPIGLVIIAGERDLSIGAIIPASSLTVAIVTGHYGAPKAVGIGAALGMGLLRGL
ncbi:MAG: hypothetical protein U1D06_09465 [Paracoccaceae bacterium]|nr:hypothetical protein [Paracoccaceae bacterium]